MVGFAFKSQMGDPGKALQTETLKSLAQRKLIGKNRGPGSWQHRRKQKKKKPVILK